MHPDDQPRPATEAPERKRASKERNRRRTQKWRLKSKATSGKRRSL